MNKIKKIFIITFPYTGHSNPLFGICKQLKQNNPNIKIYIYSDFKFKNSFQSCGCIFRNYKIECSNENWPNDINGFQIGYKSLKLAENIMYDLCNDALIDQPNLIMYDKSAFFPRICIDYIISQFESKRLNKFKIIGYSTMPQIDQDYPNLTEMKQLKINPLKLIFHAILMILMKFLFYFKNGIKTNNSFSFYSLCDQVNNETSIVFTFPQFQARSHLKDSNKFKFVGFSFDEKIRFNGKDNSIQIDPELDLFLNDSNFKLIYVSLGTIFNNVENIDVYIKIINSLKLITEKRNVKALVSTGEQCYGYLKEKFQLPFNILLVRSVPQIEILKRTFVFITHSGMNSISEAINNGVPMICLPLATCIDQPLNAYRIADELGLGLRLDSKKFEASDLEKCVLKIFDDFSFRNRCEIYKMISHKYNGVSNSAKIIEDILFGK